MAETENHPLLDKVLALAREKGVARRSQETLEEILQQIDGRQFNPRTLLLLGDLADRLLAFDGQLAAQDEEGQAGGKLDLSL